MAIHEGDPPRNQSKHNKPVNYNGRPKGIPNKTTRILKEALLMAAEIVGEDQEGKDGLVGFLVGCAREDRIAYLRVLKIVLPHQVQIEDHRRDRPYRSVEEISDELRRFGVVLKEN